MSNLTGDTAPLTPHFSGSFRGGRGRRASPEASEKIFAELFFFTGNSLDASLNMVDLDRLVLPHVECSPGVPVSERLLLRPSEVAKLLSVSRTTLRRLDLVGAIPRPLKVGRSTFWSARTLSAWEQLGCPSRRAFEAMEAAKE